MKPILRMLLAAAFCVAAPTSLSLAEDKHDVVPAKRNVWMKQKLELSQNILAGLTEADFDKITNSAKALTVSGYLEKWIERGKPQHFAYELQRANFEFYNRELIRQAKDKNIDGAALSYHLMTTSCIECHKIVRDVKK